MYSRRRKRITPWSSWVLTIAIAIVAIMTWTDFHLPSETAAQWGMVPQTYWLQWTQGSWLDQNRWTFPISAIFLHKDLIHLTGNLLFILVFSMRIERHIGHWLLLGLCLSCGGLANICAAWQTPNSLAPIIGASGITAAVLGAYLILFPRAKVGVILPLGFYWQLIHINASLLIGSWFALQLLYSIANPTFGAVAWWTHVAGFVTGLLLAAIARMFGIKVNE